MSTAGPTTVLEHRATVQGAESFYRLSVDCLEVREGSGERNIPLDDVAEAGVFRIADRAGTQLRLRAGGVAMVHASAPDDASYVDFVSALHLRLAERGRARFVRGDWVIAGGALTLGIVLGALALALQQGWLFGDVALGFKARIAVWAGFAFAALSPAAAWAARPRPYDPRSLPRDVVPR